MIDSRHFHHFSSSIGSMYTLAEMKGIIEDIGMDLALVDIQPESIEDPLLRGFWEEAVAVRDKIDGYLEDVDPDDDDEEDDFLGVGDVDFGDEDSDDDAY